MDEDGRTLLPATDESFNAIADELAESDFIDLLDAGYGEDEAAEMVQAIREHWFEQWRAAIANVRKRLVN